MWAYLIGLGVLALILVTSHLPRSGYNPATFVDNDDPVEGGELESFDMMIDIDLDSFRVFKSEFLYWIV